MFFLGTDLVQIDRRKIEYDGTFDFNKFYQLLYDILERDLRYEVHEFEYVLKGGNLEIRWECKKKVSGFMRYKIYITVFVADFEEVKVTKGGQQGELERGGLEVQVTTFLETDYMKRWEGNRVLEFLKKMYKKYIYKRTYIQHATKIWREAWTISDRLRDFFQTQGER